ncbi:MAG: HAD family hydrolase [Planctomycetota bacterium]|jgi:HAD superfamily hydrolase (TIGR01509 family)
MKFKNIIFDMGDIFFDATIWRKWLTKHLQGLGVEIDYETLCRKWDLKLVEVYVGQRKYWDRFKEFLSELGLNKKQSKATVHASREKAREIENRVLFKGVAETLHRLKEQGVKLAILSDTESNEERIRQRLEDLNICQYFDVVVTSIDIGHVKPEPEAFEAVLRKLNSSKEESAFVGHDLDELQGALDFGIDCIAYNYTGEVPATYHIENFDKLIGIVC